MGNVTQQVASDECWTDPKAAAPGEAPVAFVPFRVLPARGVARRLPASLRRSQLAPPQLAPLVRTIEAEVIPRLMLAHRAGAAGDGPGAPPIASLAAPPGAVPAGGEVLELARRLLLADPASASGFIGGLRARGASLDSLYLDLLAPAARHLGELWKEDLCDFTQVTLGLLRLHQVVRDLGPAFEHRTPRRDSASRALLVPIPGDHHTFGLMMVADFFRHAGWTVASEPLRSLPELFDMVRRDWFAVVGFSLGCESRLDALSACIRGVRRASRNAAIGVMVGGPLFIEQPELVGRVGADATAVDGRQAVLQAQTLLALLASRL